MYKENFKNRKELLNLFLNTQLKINDNFEYVLQNFFKFFIKKNKNFLGLSIYFIYWYVFLKKMKSSLVKILFFIVLNILLYFTLTFDVNFLYITINLLIIFILYEFDIYKKKIDGNLINFKNDRQ